MIALLAVVALAGTVLVIWNTGYELLPFCGRDSTLADVPPGWELAQDRHNDCGWTLFNAAGDRVPAELYATISVDPPSPRPVDQTTIGYALIVIGLGGALAVAVWALAGGLISAQSTPGSEDPT